MTRRPEDSRDDRPDAAPHDEASLHESDAEARRDLRRLLTGGAVSLALVLAAFGLVRFELVSGLPALGWLGALAAVHVIAQFRFFLHIDLQRSHRDDLLLVLFSFLVVALMVGGTIWILFNQHAQM
ncbi:cytochrome-c oxidase [Albimonas sp. CAU 1670]|uniref:cytochrome o ubiquinol oxidase subunit IV n=1 Tax=Albimonas sp. CAU 1670 TaxID=3032599 RepID=UPI0023DC21A7|nr:cytochrome-c oxidase [Albimonas sp. CAU 1670]MDF2235318.1 cytochrome-c oxidase [Albimonas sp. CAU 1670]